MAIVGWLVALLLGIGFALFSVGNQQAATINGFGATYRDIPTWVVMLASASIGALIVIVISLVERDNRISELEQEVLRLRGAA